MSISSQDTRGGLLYGLAAYGCWGLVPLYFREIGAVSPPEILAHRIVWSVVFVAILLTLWRRWPDFAASVRSGRIVRLLLISASLVAVNWLVYIHGVGSKRVMETSLGYFINPLLSVLLGMVVFRERLRPWQWVALTLATVGLVYLIFMVGELPWIALVLAGTFSLYGLVRKMTPVDGLIGLAIETMLLAPAALIGLAIGSAIGAASFGGNDRATDGLLMLSGVVTTIPLVCFGQAARRLRLSTMGFLQYLSPSMQFLLAVWVFEEPFRPEQQISFACIWMALLIFTVDALLAGRQRQKPCLAALRRTARFREAPLNAEFTSSIPPQSP
ncbi:MAG TPA: EamA family transporter RarD [Gemmataceae bacterium]|nr:EamA family transporter RarD [Gemmataceae bacterium]